MAAGKPSSCPACWLAGATGGRATPGKYRRARAAPSATVRPSATACPSQRCAVRRATPGCSASSSAKVKPAGVSWMLCSRSLTRSGVKGGAIVGDMARLWRDLGLLRHCGGVATGLSGIARLLPPEPLRWSAYQEYEPNRPPALVQTAQTAINKEAKSKLLAAHACIC